MSLLELILLVAWLSPIVWILAVFITKVVEGRRLQLGPPGLMEQGSRIPERTSKRSPVRQPKGDTLSVSYDKIGGSAHSVTLYLN